MSIQFNNLYKRAFKRLIDIVVATTGLILLSPVFVFVYVFVRATSAGDVFYIQQRVGHNEKPFIIYKFRTMRIDYKHSANKQVLGNDPAITPIGVILRRFKIDEIPQLWNVLRGDMTLVGPRPTLYEHLENYTAHQRARYKVVPGITGWAQVNGNVYLSLNYRIEHDLWYIEHLSPWLDVKILLMTLGVILFGESIKSRVEKRI